MSWSLSLGDLAKATGGKILSEGRSQTYDGVGVDTRADLKGKAFFALRGDTFDAHDFLDKSNAGAVVAHREEAARALAAKGETAVVLVDDTLLALQRLAKYWRHAMRAQILAVTGTNGKTTTKEFAAAILSTQRRAQWSRGSFNNHWGVPLSLLSIDSETQVAMIEMGMNHPGELTTLVGIADPDAVGCTMVGRGHLEGMGSIEGVAAAKAEIYEQAPPGALFIFNVDDRFVRAMMEKQLLNSTKHKMLRFGSPKDVAGPGAFAGALDVCLRVDAATETSLTVSGHVAGVAGRAEAPIFGAHNVVNLMAASCYALAAGLRGEEIWRAIPECRATWGRNQWVPLAGGARALFDAYNANPESMGAAIENFAKLQTAGRKFALLGEMREMGDAAEAVHEELGRKAAAAGFEAIAFVGASRAAFAAGLKAAGFAKKLVISEVYEKEVAREIGSMLDHQDIVLIKGSRGVRLEKAMQDFGAVNFASKG